VSKQSRLTLRTVGLPSMQPQMDSAAVRRSRRTLLCISANSTGSQGICTVSKDKGSGRWATPQARHVHSPRRHEPAGSLHEMPQSDPCRGSGIQGPGDDSGSMRGRAAPYLISQMIQASIHAVPCWPRGLGRRGRDCQKSRRWPQKASCWAHREGHRGPCPSGKGVVPAAPSSPRARRRNSTGTGLNMRFLPKMVG